MSFPIRFKCSPQFIDELASCEHGSYEDITGAVEAGEDLSYWGSRRPETHTHVVAQRFKTVLRIDSVEEAADVYGSVCSGTIQIWEYGFFNTCVKIANVLRPIVAEHDPELVELWDKPYGG